MSASRPGIHIVTHVSPVTIWVPLQEVRGLSGGPRFGVLESDFEPFFSFSCTELTSEQRSGGCIFNSHFHLICSAPITGGSKASGTPTGCSTPPRGSVMNARWTPWGCCCPRTAPRLVYKTTCRRQWVAPPARRYLPRHTALACPGRPGACCAPWGSQNWEGV